MWNNDKNFPAGVFSTPPKTWKSAPCTPMILPTEKKKWSTPEKVDSFHVIHKVPAGDSPYVKAKHVQLIDRDPNKSIALFWSAINSGDRIDSSLKDMAIVMKQLNRSDEAIEAIKSFRHLCSYQAQESLDNVLIDLYKRCGRTKEHIEMLQNKLKLVEESPAFGGKRTKAAKSHGKKFYVSIEQEKSRILGNLAWAYMQENDYQTAEEYYRKALSIEPDKNKQCNLAVCLMQRGRITEAKSLLQAVRPSSRDQLQEDSYVKSFDRALEMLAELESQSVLRPIQPKAEVKEEIWRSFTSPTNDLKAPASPIIENQNYSSGFSGFRRWDDRIDKESPVFDVSFNSSGEKENRSYSKTPFEKKVSFSGYDGERWYGEVGIEEASAGKSTNTTGDPSVLPVSDEGNSKFASRELITGLRPLQRSLFVDKWKKGAYPQNPCETGSGFSSTQKERLGMTQTETEEYYSESKITDTSRDPVGSSVLVSGDLKFAPSSFSCSFVNGDWRRTWGVGSEENQAVEPPIPIENERVKAPQHLIEGSTVFGGGNSKLRSLETENGTQSSITGNWRRRSWGEDAEKLVQSILRSSSNGDWKRRSWGNEGQKKQSVNILSSSSNEGQKKQSVNILSSSSNEDWRRRYWGDGKDKQPVKGSLIEPAMLAPENLGGSLPADSMNGYLTQTSILGCERTDTTDEKNVQRNNTHEADSLPPPSGSITGNSKLTRDFSFFKSEMSWADMVEEDEKEVLSEIADFPTNRRTYQPQESSNSFQTSGKWIDSYNEEDFYDDENLNSNIISPAHYPPSTTWNSPLELHSQKHTEDVCQNLEAVDLKEDGYTRSVNAAFRNPTTRRTLSFDQKYKQDSAARYCSSFPRKALNFDDYSCAPQRGSESPCWKNSRSMRRNRLQVFQDITLPDSPHNCNPQSVRPSQ